MTDRYILTKPMMIAHRFRTIQNVTGEPSYNIRAPAKVPTISQNADNRNEVVIRVLAFVAPSTGSNNARGITVARSETVYDRPLFRDAFRAHRCLAVADGCYLWDKKQPYLLRLKSGGLFGIAGIYAINPHFRPALNSFCILTTFPNLLVAEFCHRMPVILRPEDEARYLDPKTPLDEVRKLLLPYDDEEMEMFPVTPKLTKATTNSKEFIKPIVVRSQPDPWTTDEEDLEQLSLLD
jgi:putative SOS response-associated peptidase YedK